MKRFLASVLMLAACACGAQDWYVMTDTNGVLRSPFDNFFQVNYALMTNALGPIGAGSGSVTSVGLSGGTTGLTISGSPVTTNGTMTIGGTLNAANIDGAIATDAELAAHAALTNSHGVSNYGALLSAQSSAANARSALGLGTAATSATGDFQASSANLTTLAGGSGSPLSSGIAASAIDSGTISTNRLPFALPDLANYNAAGVTNINGYVGFSSTPTRLVLVGDSLTYGYGSTNGGYSGWITNSTYGTLPSNFILATNGGLSGKWLKTMYQNYTNEIQPFKPSGGTNSLVILWGGINDMIAGTNAATLFGYWSNLVTLCKADGFDVMAMSVTPSSAMTNSEATRLVFNYDIKASPLWDYFIDLGMIPKAWIKGFWYDGTHFTDVFYSLQAKLIADALKRPKRAVSPVGSFGDVFSYGSDDNYRGFAWSLIGRSDTYPMIALEKPGGDIAWHGIRLSKVTGALHVGSGNLSWPSEALYEMDLSGINFYRQLNVLGASGTSNTVATFSWPTSTKTANYSLAVTENNTWFNNNGASGPVTNTLPAAIAGRQYGFTILAAQQLVIKAAGTDTIRIGATVSAGGGQAATNVVGTTLHLYCPVAGSWVADSQMGAWAVQ